MQLNYYIGIDISKAKIDMAVISPTYENVLHQVCDNNIASLKACFSKLLKKLKAGVSELLICCEQTGIYGRPLEQVCTAMQLPLWVEPAIKIKYASAGMRGKSDKKDAFRIAEYCLRYADRVKLYKESPEACQKLQTLLGCRETLLLQCNQIEQQLNEASVFDKEKYQLLKSCFETPLKALKRKILQIEKEIARIKESNSEIKANAELIKSIPGIGEQTALHFIVYTKNFTTFHTANHLACYAGVAPFPDESGTIVKRARVSSLANHKLKKLLHLAAMAAIRCKGELRDYYIRKVTEGKNKMLVLNNIRNKLIKRMFVVLKNRTPYQPVKSQEALA